jgi:hypothetical protein
MRSHDATRHSDDGRGRPARQLQCPQAAILHAERAEGSQGPCEHEGEGFQAPQGPEAGKDHGQGT